MLEKLVDLKFVLYKHIWNISQKNVQLLQINKKNNETKSAFLTSFDKKRYWKKSDCSIGYITNVVWKQMADNFIDKMARRRDSELYPFSNYWFLFV